MSGVNDTYNPVLVKSFSEIFFSVTLENTGNCWDTENYPLILPSVALIVITNFLFLDVYSI